MRCSSQANVVGGALLVTLLAMFTQACLERHAGRSEQEGGEYSTLEVAELFGVGWSTVYRAIKRQRTAAKAVLPGASTRR